jgi:hypothetical protein
MVAYSPACLLVNAGEILQRLAGVKVQHGRKQEGFRYRGPSTKPPDCSFLEPNRAGSR